MYRTSGLSYKCIVLLAIAHATQVLGAAVTLYMVDLPLPSTTGDDTPSVSIDAHWSDIYSPVHTSTGSDGPVTAYEWKNIMSKVDLVFPSSTVPVVTAPYTQTYTIHQAAATYTLHGDSSGSDSDAPPSAQISLHDQCKFDTDKGTGECVREDVRALVVGAAQTGTGPASYVTTGTTTIQTTFTGTLRPVATFEVKPSSAAAVARLSSLVAILGLVPMLFIIL